MKKVLMISACMILVTGIMLIAADKQSEKCATCQKCDVQELKKGPGDMGLGLYERLNLTEQQKERIKEIRKNSREQLKALKQDTTLTNEQKKEKMKQIHEATQKQMDEVLTPEQRQQMEKIRAEMRERMKEHWQKKSQGGQKAK